MGTGGLPQLSVNYPEIEPELNTQLNYLWHKMSALSNESSFAYELRADLVSSVCLQEEMYRFTPSIYPAYGRISSPYGWRIHPISGRRIFHNGLDIANQLGSPIYVTAEGVVKETGYNRSYGRYIIITHKFGYETMYAHLQKSLKKRGEQVERGEIIGHMGSSGISTGSHVHYEIRRYGKTVNPYQYLNKMEEDIVITKK
jgi:murein DD-endopeptidase MepM/ murein hydrolase activator NlpD